MHFTILRINFLLIGFLGCIQLFAQAPLNRLYGTYGSESGKAGLILQDSTIYALGTSSAFPSLSSQVYLIKTDKNGDLLWTKFYGGTGVDDAVDMYVDLSIDTSIYIIANSFISFNKGYDVKMFKVDKNGNLIWEKNYGTNDWDVPARMIKTSTNLFAICGKTYGNSFGLTDGMLMLLDSNGDSLAFQNFGDAMDNSFLDIVERSADSLVICGESFTSSGKKRAWLVEMNIETGNATNSYFGSTYNRTFNSIEIYPNGNYLIGITTDSAAVTQTDMFVQILNKNTHNVALEIPVFGTSDESCVEATYLNNEICFMGQTRSYGFGGLEVVVYRFDTLGAYLGAYTFGSAADDYGADLLANGNSSFAVIGTSGGAFGVEDLWIINVDSIFQNDDILDSQLDFNAVHEQPYSAIDLIVFPNPFSEVITVQSTEIPAKLVVYDAFGRLLSSVENTSSINLTNLNAGIYFLIVQFKEGFVGRKMPYKK